MTSENLTSRIDKHIVRIAGAKGCNERQINTIRQLVRTIREDGIVTNKQLEKCFELVGGEIDN